MQLLALKVSADYYSHPPRIVSLLILTITYMRAINSLYIYIYTGYIYILYIAYIYTQGEFNSHTTHSLFRILVTEASVVGVMKMGNIVPRAGIEPTSLVFPASVLLLHHIGSGMSPPPTCLGSFLPQVSADYYICKYLLGGLEWGDSSIG